MSEERWSNVDDYFVRHLVPPDEPLDRVRAANAAAGLPAIDVSPTQGRLLYLFTKLAAARHILEIGTLGGYSTLWMAKGLAPGGKIVTLELEPRHAEVARGNFAAAGAAARIEVIVGRALDSLAVLRDRGGPPFDLVFIDADKANTAEYFRRAVGLCRPGALVITDNVVRKGQLADADSSDPSVVGMRRFVESLAQDERVEATGIQTVGAKGYDGFVIARVRG